jgi:ribonuclease P protein component
MEERKYTLGKSERLCSKKLIERLFAGGNKSFPAFPMRVVYMPLGAEEEGAEVSILISVPKKRFKRAVKRNLVKRQVREAYRRNKYILLDALRQSEHPEKLVLAFIWLDSRLHSSDEVEHKMKKLLYHIAEEKLQ